MSAILLQMSKFITKVGSLLQMSKFITNVGNFITIIVSLLQRSAILLQVFNNFITSIFVIGTSLCKYTKQVVMLYIVATTTFGCAIIKHSTSSKLKYTK